MFFSFVQEKRGETHPRFEVVRSFSCAKGTGREALCGGYGGGRVDVHARATEMERRRVLGHAHPSRCCGLAVSAHAAHKDEAA